MNQLLRRVVAAPRSFAGVTHPFLSLSFSTDNIHRSNAETLINLVPVIEVDSHVALCDGGGGALGHPIEYIKLNNVDPTIPVPCKYCGLRFVQKSH